MSWSCRKFCCLVVLAGRAVSGAKGGGKVIVVPPGLYLKSALCFNSLVNNAVLLIRQ